jgi:hypothetical protein
MSTKITINEQAEYITISEHQGKMTLIPSISTSKKLNENCQRMSCSDNCDCICKYCYADKTMAMYPRLEKSLENNTAILTRELTFAEVKEIAKFFLNTTIARFESFGDLINVNQVINYFNIARKNPDTLCALWTKNPQIIAKAMNLYGIEKPKNLQIVLSSPFVNKAIKATRFDFVDKVFTVYDKNESKKVDINCGARSCLACGRCYRPNPDGVKLQHIREILK